MIRQGDVLLVPIEDHISLTPKPARQTPLSRHGKLVIAEGETSLHEHTLDAEDAILIQQGDRMLLALTRDQDLAVTHTATGEMLPRHTPIRVGAGFYEVRIQRRAEITPAGMPQRWTTVRD